MGLLAEIAKNDKYKALRDEIGLNAKSRVLLFSTEGDTDPDRYKSAIWDGLEN